jgi:heptosyltransferase II
MRTLIVKLGAMGDVLRTTALLRALEGDVDWLTAPAAVPLLENNPFLSRVLTAPEPAQHYDCVLSLDEDLKAVGMAVAAGGTRLVGIFYNEEGERIYTPETAPWFDMGLISCFGKTRADALKKANRRSFQEYLFEMTGRKFQEEEYVLALTPWPFEADHALRVGIECRAGARWPLKKWDKYDLLIDALEKEGVPVTVFSQREDVRDYMRDIQGCDVVVTGDTLCLHIAIALRKQTVAIFGPTPADEIHGYGRVRKIIAPLDCIKCYKNACDFDPNCMQSIPLAAVHDAVRGALEDAARLREDNA